MKKSDVGDYSTSKNSYMYKRSLNNSSAAKKLPYETILKINDTFGKFSKSLADEDLPFRKSSNSFFPKKIGASIVANPI